MCDIEEYAIIFLISNCLKAVKEQYTKPSKLRIVTRGIIYMEPKGNTGTTHLINPYPPNFKRNAAKITEPTVGASTWASGSHMCKGNIGNFTAKPKNISIQIKVCFLLFIIRSCKTNKSVVPNSDISSTIEKNNKTDPKRV